jgi:branched-chain amino acid transport system substrate-binding protein
VALSTWGDFILNAVDNVGWNAAGIHTVDVERYGRTDTSVTDQVIKLLSANPDAILVGGSGAGSALPHTALVVRGYKKQIYHNHGTVSREFIKAGGKMDEGAIAPTGPLIVAEDLPADNPVRPVALDFINRYEQTFGAHSRQAGHARVPRIARRAGEVHNTHGVYNMTANDHSGLDDRARVLVRIENGDWQLLK